MYELPANCADLLDSKLCLLLTDEERRVVDKILDLAPIDWHLGEITVQLVCQGVLRLRPSD
jgi:hypothetical protein